MSIQQGEGSDHWKKLLNLCRQAFRHNVVNVSWRDRLASVLVVLLTGTWLLGTPAFGRSGGCSGPDFDQNNPSCNQFPQNQVVRLQYPGSQTQMLRIDITIDQSCNKGTCQNGKCNLISDRWGITNIVKAVEGAVHTIVNPPVVVKSLPSRPFTVKKFGQRVVFSCLGDSLRKQLLQNLSRGITVVCVDDPNHLCRPPAWDRGHLACACVAPDDYPNHIFLNNQGVDTCMEKVYSPGRTPPSAEKDLERTMFHEILHIMGNLDHTVPETDILGACDKACYGSIATGDPTSGPMIFDRINSDLCFQNE